MTWYPRQLGDCPTCEGEGTVEHPFLSGPYKGSHSETPDDPAMVECEDCDGTGQQEIKE